MKVEFFRFAPQVASGRLRGSIPQAELAKLGVLQGRDVVIASKHGWPDAAVAGARKVVFDVCDDHFSTQHADHYAKWCKRADAVTCSTPGLAARILEVTGRQATVIPDPYEQPECAPGVHEQLLWFGHASNLPDLARVYPRLRWPLTIVTNNAKREAIEWSPEAMDAAFDAAGLVIIPTGNKPKSANRAVEAIRRGLYVAAEPLASYAELGIWQGDIPQGIEWALSHPQEVLRRIEAAQAYVREEFSPERIARMWLAVLEKVCTPTS